MCVPAHHGLSAMHAPLLTNEDIVPLCESELSSASTMLNILVNNVSIGMFAIAIADLQPLCSCVVLQSL